MFFNDGYDVSSAVGDSEHYIRNCSADSFISFILLLLGSIRCTKIYIYFFVFFILSFQSFFLFYSRMRIAEACGVLAKQRNPNPDIEMLKHLRRHGATRCFIFLFSFFVFFSLRRTSWATE